MTTSRIHHHVAVFSCAIALMFQISPALAQGQRDNDHKNGPVDITFTKWGGRTASAGNSAAPFGLFEGFSDDGLVGSFVAEVLWRQASVNGHVAGLEALYEVVDGDRSFSAIIRGGSERRGRGPARRRHPGRVAHRSAGARRVSAVSRDPRGVQLRGRAALNKNCFVGTIHVGRAPQD